MFAVMDRLRLVDPSVRKVRLVPVSREKLVLDLGYLLAAIPSSSFPPHPSSLRFQPAPGLCLGVGEHAVVVILLVGHMVHVMVGLPDKVHNVA